MSPEVYRATLLTPPCSVFEVLRTMNSRKLQDAVQRAKDLETIRPKSRALAERCSRTVCTQRGIAALIDSGMGTYEMNFFIWVSIGASFSVLLKM